MERDEYDLLTDHLVIDFLELPRLGENCKIDDELAEWLNFFASKEGQKAMVDYHSPEVQEAVRAYENFISDPELREAYEVHLKASLDRNSALGHSYREGVRDNALENAHKMLAKGLSIELVAECTDLTIDEVKALI